MRIPYNCHFCRGTRQRHFFSLQKLCRHLEIAHAHQANFILRCRIDGCPKQYRKMGSYRKHIRRCHNARHLQEPEAEEHYDAELVEVDNISLNDFNAEAEVENVVDIEAQIMEDLSRSMGLLSLKLRERHVIPGVVSEDVCISVKNLLLEFVENYRKLQEQDPNPPENTHTVLLETVENAFLGISSDHMLVKYCKERLGMVTLTAFVLGQTENGKNETMQYVSVLGTIKAVLQNEDIVAHILQREENSGNKSDLMLDYADGSIYHEHPFFGTASNSLKLRLYFYIDEFEVVNPLGSKRGKHKLTAVYFTLGNMHSKYRSKLEYIYLCMMVRYKHVKKYSYDAVFQPLIKELDVLKNTGIIVQYQRQNLTVRGTIVTVSADNLSAHDLSGFQTHFNAGRICRFCMARKEDIASKLCEEDFVIRTTDIHKYHVEAVKEDISNIRIYGVRNECPLTRVETFDVTKSFTPDFMHDCLEGVFPLITKIVLQDLIRSRIIRLQDINSAIRNLKFGQNDSSNTPTEITERMLGHGLAGKASEKWCLFRLLPQLIGHLVPVGESSWKLYLMIREIAEYVMAPRIRKSWLAYLSDLITQFLELLAGHIDSFPCKVHYMIHYPRLMLLYGPLCQFWCMRFEARHEYFKKLASVVCNFRNIARTLTVRHQQMKCWELGSRTALGTVTHERGGSTVEFESLPEALKLSFRDKLASSGLEYNGEIICKFDEVVKDNVKYATNDCFVVDLLHEEEIPLFVEAKYILYSCNMWLICSCIMMAEAFEEHYFAYKVRRTTEWLTFLPGEENDYHALDTYRSVGNMYIPLRYKVTATR